MVAIMQSAFHFIKLTLVFVLLIRENAEGKPFVVPEEIASLFGVVSSYLPPVKAGESSRQGVGFRLGDHADFQFMWEIGPQTRTRPIGLTNGASDQQNKREVMSSERKRWIKIIRDGAAAEAAAKKSVAKSGKKKVPRTTVKTSTEMVSTTAATTSTTTKSE